MQEPDPNDPPGTVYIDNNMVDDVLSISVVAPTDRPTLRIPYLRIQEVPYEIDISSRSEPILDKSMANSSNHAKLARLIIRQNIRIIKQDLVNQFAGMLLRQGHIKTPYSLEEFDQNGEIIGESKKDFYVPMTEEMAERLANRLADIYIKGVDLFLSEHPGARPMLGSRHESFNVSKEARAAWYWWRITGDIDQREKYEKMYAEEYLEFELKMAPIAPWCADWARVMADYLDQEIGKDDELKKYFSIRHIQWYWGVGDKDILQHNFIAVWPNGLDYPLGPENIEENSVLFLDPWVTTFPFAYHHLNLHRPVKRWTVK